MLSRSRFGNPWPGRRRGYQDVEGSVFRALCKQRMGSASRSRVRQSRRLRFASIRRCLATAFEPKLATTQSRRPQRNARRKRQGARREWPKPLATKAFLAPIVVTAQKRREKIQDVGISITALSGETIKTLNLSNMQQISQQVPNLQVSAWTPAFTTFNLRGISQNNFQDNLEAPVAVYQDEVYVGSMNALGLPIFDVERIEVLRGPQGTLFGRNATGGLIQFISQSGGRDAAQRLCGRRTGRMACLEDGRRGRRSACAWHPCTRRRASTKSQRAG